MIRIFEDFPLGMWGYTPIDTWTEDENQTKMHYRRQEKPLGSFQIISRRTFIADAARIPLQTTTASTPSPNAQESGCLNKQPRLLSSCDEHSEDTRPEDKKSEDILFLKSAWPKMKWPKEPEVIIEAYKRAEALLRTEAWSVADHLPVIVNFEELAYTSTEIIRRLVKSTTTDGFCVQLWILSKKLQLSIRVRFGQPFGIRYAVRLSFSHSAWD